MLAHEDAANGLNDNDQLHAMLKQFWELEMIGIVDITLFQILKVVTSFSLASPSLSVAIRSVYLGKNAIQVFLIILF